LNSNITIYYDLRISVVIFVGILSHICGHRAAVFRQSPAN